MKRRGSGSKQKGASFERSVCRLLSRWITNGKKEDCFWRSSISGGRATVQARKGNIIRQSGDICAVAPEGHVLTDRYFLELKHVNSLEFGQFIYNGVGKLGRFWKKAMLEAERQNRDPMIIARQNRWHDCIVVTKPNHLNHICRPIASIHAKDRACDIYLFSHWMAKRYKP